MTTIVDFRDGNTFMVETVVFQSVVVFMYILEGSDSVNKMTF